MKKMTIEQNVEFLLRTIPKCRDNYMMLLLMYWSLVDGLPISPELIMRIVATGTQPESISRAKRKNVENNVTKVLLQAEGRLNDLRKNQG